APHRERAAAAPTVQRPGPAHRAVPRARRLVGPGSCRSRRRGLRRGPRDPPRRPRPGGDPGSGGRRRPRGLGPARRRAAVRRDPPRHHPHQRPGSRDRRDRAPLGARRAPRRGARRQRPPARRLRAPLPAGDRPAGPAHRGRAARADGAAVHPGRATRAGGAGDRSMSFLPGGRERLGPVSQNEIPETAATVRPVAPPTLYTGIVRYGAKDPEAAAMLVADGLIAWTGPEDTGRLLHGDAEIVDATGCLVTPGFVDAAATADGAVPDESAAEDAAARGIVLRLPGPTGVRDGVRVIAPVTESAAYLDLLADGTPLAFGSAGAPEAADPWDWVRGAARTSPAAQRISDRAAFLAA